MDDTTRPEERRRRVAGIVGGAALAIGIAGYAVVVELGSHVRLVDSCIPLVVASAFLQVAGLNGLFWSAWWRHANRMPEAIYFARTTRRAVALAAVSPPAVVLLALV